MIRTGRITGRGTDTYIFFDQFFIAEVLIFYIAPVFRSRTFSCSTSANASAKTVGQCLQHDLVVIISALQTF